MAVHMQIWCYGCILKITGCSSCHLVSLVVEVFVVVLLPLFHWLDCYDPVAGARLGAWAALLTLSWTILPRGCATCTPWVVDHLARCPINGICVTPEGSALCLGHLKIMNFVCITVYLSVCLPLYNLYFDVHSHQFLLCYGYKRPLLHVFWQQHMGAPSMSFSYPEANPSQKQEPTTPTPEQKIATHLWYIGGGKTRANTVEVIFVPPSEFLFFYSKQYEALKVHVPMFDLTGSSSPPPTPVYAPVMSK